MMSLNRCQNKKVEWVFKLHIKSSNAFDIAVAMSFLGSNISESDLAFKSTSENKFFVITVITLYIFIYLPTFFSVS